VKWKGEFLAKDGTQDMLTYGKCVVKHSEHLILTRYTTQLILVIYL